MKRYFLLFLCFLGCLFAFSFLGNAHVEIPGSPTISDASIGSSVTSGSIDKNTLKDFGFQLLSLARIAVSGLALIYIVLVGVYMVIFSDNESQITKQKKQLIYVLVAFLFLNLPSLVYDVMIGTGRTGGEINTGEQSWVSIDYSSSFFWNWGGGFEGILGGIIDFLRVFVYGIAIIVFAWGAFALIFGSHEEDARKKAQTKFMYGIFGLIFMGFVDLWAAMIANSDIGASIQKTGSAVIGIATYFAAPIAIFFLILGAYYMITSGGNDERIKKGKNIIINTFIAAIILIASLSFLFELTNFSF
ncbi:hypothetical protein CSB09_02100 [Candidatus Gracilibacteria bacterium]|nr:MAG: hypothetical protein CSB09_02100 [Candidatus Gracilibacteria bacterium]